MTVVLIGTDIVESEVTTTERRGRMGYTVSKEATVYVLVGTPSFAMLQRAFKMRTHVVFNNERWLITSAELNEQFQTIFDDTPTMSFSLVAVH